MPSPFPGMNPYLEKPAVWQDFHHSFVSELRRQLAPQVSPGYVTKLEEHLYIHEPSAEQRRLAGRGDLTISQQRENRGSAGTALADAPCTVTLTYPAIDTERQAYLEIRDRVTWKIITVIELLSPANKDRGADRDDFLNKRRLLLYSDAHYVEIDLLRGGPRMPFEDAPPCDYCVLVSRVEKRQQADFWPIHLRQPLPMIPIPLKAGDADARLDLQAALHTVYDEAFYRDFIYDEPPVPPLTAEDQAWAQGLVPPPI